MIYDQARDWWSEHYCNYRQYKPRTERAILRRMGNVTADYETTSNGHRSMWRGAATEVLLKGLFDAVFSPQHYYLFTISDHHIDHRGIDIEVDTQDSHKSLGIDAKSRGHHCYFSQKFHSTSYPELPFWRVRVSTVGLGVFDLLQQHSEGIFLSPQQFMEERLYTNESLRSILNSLQQQAGRVVASHPGLNGAGEFLSDFATTPMPPLRV